MAEKKQVPISESNNSLIRSLNNNPNLQTDNPPPTLYPQNSTPSSSQGQDDGQAGNFQNAGNTDQSSGNDNG